MQKFRHHKDIESKPDKVISISNTSETTKGLLQLMEEKIEGKSRTEIKSLLKNRHVKVDGEITTQYNREIQPSFSFEVNLSRPFVELKNARVRLVYEDDHIIVINKGYGLLSVSTPSSKKEQTAYDIVREYVKKKNVRNKLYVVHRLDRDTSGLMMFAKTEEAQEILRHNWNNFVLERLYDALLEGYVEKDEGFVKSRLEENSKYVVYSIDDPERGKLAVTRYKVLKRGNGLSLVEFSLDTGRKNQIRVHAKDLGHPISGDRKYGARPSKLNRLCLHARTLRFAHPITKKDMNFELPMPLRFEKAVGYSSKKI